MNLEGVFLVVFILIVTYYLRHLQSVAQMGGEESDVNLNVRESIYARQFRELNNVNNVLKRPIEPGDATTNNLIGFESSVLTTSRPAELHSFRTVLQLFKKAPVANPITHELRKRVKDRQPYFLRKPYIKTHYGQTYYADANYPLFLVDTAFAEDPAKFITERPMEYPSYVILSRTPCSTPPRPAPTGLSLL